MFGGFKPLSANFTPTPNQFFDEVLGRYPLRVVTVVGILIRATLGWSDEVTGERRVEAELPLSAFLRPELSENSARQGLREAIAAGFVVQTASPTNRDGARYALRWEDAAAQQEAIRRARRATSDRLADAPVGGADSGGAVFGPPESGGAESAPPIKKRSPRNKALARPERETLNVAGADGYRSGSEAVERLVTLTGDTKSRRRFEQLFEIAQDAGWGSAWDEAERSLRNRLARESLGPLEKPGAYFCKALTEILGKRGVAVPAGSAEERSQVRGVIAQSLGLSAGHEAGTPGAADRR